MKASEVRNEQKAFISFPIGMINVIIIELIIDVLIALSEKKVPIQP